MLLLKNELIFTNDREYKSTASLRLNHIKLRLHICEKKGGDSMRKLVKKIAKQKAFVSFYFCENTGNCNGR